MSTVKELNISPVGRVEGDLDVKVLYGKWSCNPCPYTSRNVSRF